VDERPARLDIDLATPEPIPAEGIAAATELLRTGRLFRYAEAGGQPSEAAAWEQEFAAYLGRRYAVAVNSCGAALYLALHSVGVRPGDAVLVNSWTLAPVPGAVAHAGARPVLVETTPDLTVDLGDLERRAAAHPGAVLLLSHMRGHIADLEAVTALCDRHGLRLVEDCAHSLGGGWSGRPTGTFGAVGCFSTQTYKHLNSGEGGVLVTDDDEIAARAILASGSYALYTQHTSRPPVDVLHALAASEPNHSMRLTNLAAAVLRPQLRSLPARVAAWNSRYDRLADGLAELPDVRLPVRPPAEEYVGSSLQFFVDLPAPDIARFCAEADSLGVHVKWFGAPRPSAFTSAHQHWHYAGRQTLPETDAVLDRLCDIRVPLALPLDRCDDVVSILRHSLTHARTASTTTRT
jgi:dTDP-4-amino-4,6-dideoxygalactose transaminase